MSERHLTFIQSFTITGKNMIYLYHSCHAAEVIVKYKMASCKKGNRTKKDGINLTEIYFEGENEHTFSSNLISVVYLEK